MAKKNFCGLLRKADRATTAEMTTPFNKLPWKLESIEAGVLAVVCENVLPEISGTRVVDLAKMFIGALKKKDGKKG